MVLLFRALLNSVKKKPRKHFQSKFIDSLRLTVRGGHGGNGVPKYGGVGGQGGCVYVIAKDDVTLRKVALKYPTKRIAASPGEDSCKIRILGRRGLDEEVEVPVGVQVLEENGKILSDLNEPGATYLLAGGGIGGCTGTNFLGKPGDAKTITLDLKLIADVGLVGFPNAGKSTLLKAISNASPKIASYPFTTIRPQVGVVKYQDLRLISIADLPGLIEGAHANIGMGHKFLKHIERTRLILMVVDIFGFQLSQSHIKRNCLQNIYALNKELELYDETLLDKPCVLLVNKMDLHGAKKELESIKPFLNDLESGLKDCPEEIKPERLINFERVIPISARNRERIDVVKRELRDVLDEAAEKKLNLKDSFENIREKLRERGARLT